MAIIRLKDTELDDICTGYDEKPGCMTCGYGGHVIHEFRLTFSNGKALECEHSATKHSFHDDCRGKLLTSDDLLKIFGDSDIDFRETTFDEFCDWFFKKLKEVRPSDSDPVSMRLVEIHTKEWNE